MAATTSPSRDQLLQWFNAIHPLNIDIVGDFAGKDLFAIHGEAMLVHCVREANVDFEDGFQLLHAVHAVESFLRKLADRGCNFHILWFDKYEHLSVPRDVPEHMAYKYLLTRTVLMQHLANPSNLDRDQVAYSYRFSDLDSDACRGYLNANAVHFMLCSHGNATKSEQDPRSLDNLSIGYQMAAAGYSVAFINNLTFHSSKVHASITSPSGHFFGDGEDASSLTAGEADAEAEPQPSATDDSSELSEESDSDSDDVSDDDDSATSVSDEEQADDSLDLQPFSDEEGAKGQTTHASNFISSQEADISLAKEQMDKIATLAGEAPLSARELITLHALSQMLLSEPKRNLRRVAVHLVHLVTLRYCKLSQRSFANSRVQLGRLHDMFMREFSTAASAALDNWFAGKMASTQWDAYDLLDGRVYRQVSSVYSNMTLPEHLHSDVMRLANILASVSSADITSQLPASASSQVLQGSTGRVQPTTTAVLPFSHPVLDSFLQEVHVKTADVTDLPAGPKIYQELTHWHSVKKPLDPKFIPKPPGFHARKRNQKFMADTIAYSASLTGSTGKTIDPEIIVVQTSTTDKKPKVSSASATSTAASGSGSGQQDWKAALKEKAAAAAAGAKGGKAAVNKKQPAKSGKQKALEAAEALKAGKTQEKSLAVIAFWAKRCMDLEKEPILTRRYAKAQKYLLDLSTAHETAVGSEVSLYLCHVLALLRGSKDVSQRSIPDILAMLWSQALATQRFPMTQEIAAQLIFVAKGLDIPFNPPAGLPSRRLPFTSSISKAAIGLPANTGPLDFQMNYCGPYLERSFDSAPDPRVPFSPDAWQRKVLDGIDADKSLFVVAPTSAGKTFISFYAMKKVLQASNDDVLVYVAPTKALVNQIAAEIQARFSKSYHSEGQEGKSIWAIHTRDYRVNNPHKCQILVTVPHVLQIMLLSPSNANKPSAWARRVKRIIFDEVHCIGQSEDGVIWEQLLLLAPCPIIALSATVGNPVEFKDWLESTARVKGYNFEMVVHGSRYSDLRKFLYDAPPPPEFKGLAPVERLPFPGLDAADADTTRFAFVHPIGAIIGKSLDTLNDINLEPRDCLSLWHCMLKHQTKQHPVDKGLDPKKFFSKLVTKSDVVKWETALKKQLGSWMSDSTSPFDAVRRDLLGERYSQLVQDSSKKPYAPKRGDGEYDLTEFALILDLRKNGALPAIIFNYDRYGCEQSLFGLLKTLEAREAEYRETSSDWASKVADFEKWKRSREKMKFKAPKATKKGRGDDEEGSSKLDMAREEANRESSPWESFDAEAPITEFSFADMTKISREELDSQLDSLKWRGCKPELINALRRGLGVHHAGMNRQYRQSVEMLFRKGYLTVVVATGTLALGLNMPCKTVVFTGDSVFLSALNYRQASGRAGRRGFDLLGNVVFHGIPPHRSLEIMSARLPDLRGQFPTSVTLILRLMTLLHGTDNSDYASMAVKSLFSQSRLYLGGPAAQHSIKHHLRFSIDYLQRQHLLSHQGVPLGLAGLVGHLYHTENSAFAFHSLLNDGYFHKLCANIADPTKQTQILRKMVLILSHLFVRIPVLKHNDKQWLDNIVHRSPSLVILPDLPKGAAQILKRHNKETLDIFQGYVTNYAAQHLADKVDNELPWTKHRVEPASSDVDLGSMLHSRPETLIRSPFSALSGFTDNFKTVGELCRTVRSDVFLEESAIPSVRISKQERQGVPWNAYIYDFFKHGDLTALVRDNGIKGDDVWFFLKDFSLILATVTASLANFLNPDAAESADDAMIDVQDVGDEIEETAAAKDDTAGSNTKTVVDEAAERMGAMSLKPKKKRKAVDSWEDEEDSDDETDNAEASATPAWSPTNGESLVNVHQAFVLLQEEFDAKFRKIWA